MTAQLSGRKAVWLLTLVQALSLSYGTIVFASGAVIGNGLAPLPALATLPISFLAVGLAAATLPAGMIAERFGRRRVFLLGQLIGFSSGLLGALAITISSFPLFCLTTFLAGAYNAILVTYRFAAAECVEPEVRARALTTLLAGGIAAGFIGTFVINSTMDLVPEHTFVGSYLAGAAISAIAALLLLVPIKLPSLRHVGPYQGRPITKIMRQPLFISAVVAGIVSYLIMNYLMTAAPLAMRMHGHSQHQANEAILWHVVGMYAPSFVAGWLIVRYGASNITGIGLIITIIAAIVGLTGMSYAHFLISLIILGIGWNFGFSGASNMILDTHRPEEAARIQSVNDFLIFTCVAFGSFASGGILTTYGWPIVCLLALPPVVVALAALIFFRRRGQKVDQREHQY